MIYFAFLNNLTERIAKTLSDTANKGEFPELEAFNEVTLELNQQCSLDYLAFGNSNGEKEVTLLLNSEVKPSQDDISELILYVREKYFPRHTSIRVTRRHEKRQHLKQFWLTLLYKNSTYTSISEDILREKANFLVIAGDCKSLQAGSDASLSSLAKKAADYGVYENLGGGNTGINSEIGEVFISSTEGVSPLSKVIEDPLNRISFLHLYNSEGKVFSEILSEKKRNVYTPGKKKAENIERNADTGLLAWMSLLKQKVLAIGISTSRRIDNGIVSLVEEHDRNDSNASKESLLSKDTRSTECNEESKCEPKCNKEAACEKEETECEIGCRQERECKRKSECEEEPTRKAGCEEEQECEPSKFSKTQNKCENAYQKGRNICKQKREKPLCEGLQVEPSGTTAFTRNPDTCQRFISTDISEEKSCC